MKVREEQGSVAVLFAVAAAVLVGFAAISVDAGQLYFARARASNVADFAVMAGARHLPDDSATARSVAYSVIQQNGIDPAAATVTVSLDQRSMTVNITQQHNLYFARILGHDQAQVAAEATARVAGISAAVGAVPLGIPLQDFVLGQPVTLKMSAEDGTVSPGNFQALALGHNGSSSYEYNLRNGYPARLAVGDVLPTETGNMAGPTRRAIGDRLEADPYAVWTQFSRTSSRVVLVPVVSPYPNGKGEVTILSFAVFFVESVGTSGNDASVTGRFIRFIADAEMDPLVPDNGAVGVKLVG